MKKRILRNLSTAASRDFWSRAEEAAQEFSTWPDWRRAGINVAHVRSEDRLFSGESVPPSERSQPQQASE